MTKKSEKAILQPTLVSWEVEKAEDVKDPHYYLTAQVLLNDSTGKKDIFLPFGVGFLSIEQAKQWVETTGINLWPHCTDATLAILKDNGIDEEGLPLSFRKHKRR
jgi:hypothetical protein